MSDKKISIQKNNETFIIEIKACENNSWQGVLTWVQQQKQKPFRSALELIKMIDSVLSTDDITSL